MDFINIPILLFSLLLSVSILTSLISSRIGIPLILAFLCIGLSISAGDLDLFQEIKRPAIIFFIGSVALAMILFDSGFHTALKNYKQNAKPSLILSTVGVILTALILAPFARWILDLSWLNSFLLVSIIGSTDSAAVFSLLRSKGLGLREKVKSTLEIESGTNDPMAVFMSLSFILLIQKSLSGESVGYGFLLPSLFQQGCIGTLMGFLTAFCVRYFVNKIRLDNALYPIFVLGLTLVGFSATNLLGGSGFLAIYIAGLILGNTRLKAYVQVSKFQKTLTWLSQITMFTCLGMFVSPAALKESWGLATWVAIILMFFARPLMVFTILHFFKQYNTGDKIFISFVGLRGATSFLLALMPIVLGLPYADVLFNITFVIVLISLAVQGFAIPLVGRWCGVTIPTLASAPVRTLIDLPDLPDSSLVMYQLDNQSAVLSQTNIPRWAKPTLVVRKGISYPAGIGLRQLKEGDRVYVFLSSQLQRSSLDKIYGRSMPDENADLGDFPISCQTTFEELEKLYGIQVDKGIRANTIADLFKQEFAEVEVGDRLILDAVELVVHEVEKGKVVRVGIDIDPKHNHSLKTRIKRFSWANIKKRLTRMKNVLN